MEKMGFAEVIAAVFVADMGVVMVSVPDDGMVLTIFLCIGMFLIVFFLYFPNLPSLVKAVTRFADWFVFFSDEELHTKIASFFLFSFFFSFFLLFFFLSFFHSFFLSLIDG